jgi:hypothetical protein
VTYPDPPSPPQYQCTLQLRGPETVFVNLFKEPRNRFPAWRAGTKTLFVVPARRPHRLAESIHRNRLLGSLNVYKYGLRSGPSLPLSVLLLSGSGTYTSTLYSYKVSGGVRGTGCVERGGVGGGGGGVVIFK